jgi:FAD/FMN-containing dehydrogenase
VVAKTLEASNQEEKTDWGVMKEKIRADLKRYIVKETSRRPLIMPVILDFDPGTIPLPAVTKNTAGYLLRPGMDWVDLFAGSEGTLGVVTEARVACCPRRPLCWPAWSSSPMTSAALDAVERGAPPKACACSNISTAFARSAAREVPEIPAARKRGHAVRPGAPPKTIPKWMPGSTASGGRRVRRGKLVRALRRRPRALPQVPPRAAGTGERYRPPLRRAEDEYRLRRAARAQSRDAGVLPAASGARIPGRM